MFIDIITTATRAQKIIPIEAVLFNKWNLSFYEAASSCYQYMLLHIIV